MLGGDRIAGTGEDAGAQARARRRTRWITLACSTALGILGLIGARHWIRDSRPVLAFHMAEPVVPVRASAVAALADLPGQELAPREPQDWTFHLSAEQAARFFPPCPGALVYDAWSYSRGASNRDDVLEWPEHGQAIRIRTNALGCREDRELTVPFEELRVLVVGDSHADGVCENAESFANVLEAALEERMPQRGIEVLNAALGGHSLFNYLGTWFRLRKLEPQVFVVAIFGGNDLGDILPLYLYFVGRHFPPSPLQRDRAREQARALAPEAVGQGLDQIEMFKHLPAEREPIVGAASYLVGEMQRFTRAAGAELVLLYIPSPFELEKRIAEPKHERAQQLLGLVPADLDAAHAMNADFLERVRAQGITVVDLSAVFDAEASPPYWRADLHLNVRGHALAAAALLPVVEARLARR